MRMGRSLDPSTPAMRRHASERDGRRPIEGWRAAGDDLAPCRRRRTNFGGESHPIEAAVSGARRLLAGRR